MHGLPRDMYLKLIKQNAETHTHDTHCTRLSRVKCRTDIDRQRVPNSWRALKREPVLDLSNDSLPLRDTMQTRTLVSTHPKWGIEWDRVGGSGGHLWSTSLVYISGPAFRAIVMRAVCALSLLIAGLSFSWQLSREPILCPILSPILCLLSVLVYGFWGIFFRQSRQVVAHKWVCYCKLAIASLS
jgi:hypothetical protein